MGALVPSETKNGTIEKWNSTKEKKLFVKLKKKHESKKDIIYQNISKQMGLFEQINERNIIFTQKKEDNATTRKREQIIHGINASVMEYHDMYSKLKQGKQFYGDLRLRVDQLKQTVSGHVHGRALEAREVLLNIQRQDGMARQMETDQKFAMDLATPPPPINNNINNNVTPVVPPSYSSSSNNMNNMNNMNNVNNMNNNNNNNNPSAPPMYSGTTTTTTSNNNNSNNSNNNNNNSNNSNTG